MTLKNYRHFGAFLILITLGFSHVRGEQWNGITPLRSTRHDVQKLLGKENERGFYQLPHSKTRIFYGAGDSASKTCWGRADIDLVVSISVDVEESINIRDKKIDLKQFKKTVDSSHPSESLYTDWDKGIAYSVHEETGEIYTVYYYPTRGDCSWLLARKNRG